MTKFSACLWVVIASSWIYHDLQIKDEKFQAITWALLILVLFFGYMGRLIK